MKKNIQKYFRGELMNLAFSCNINLHYRKCIIIIIVIIIITHMNDFATETRILSALILSDESRLYIRNCWLRKKFSFS